LAWSPVVGDNTNKGKKAGFTSPEIKFSGLGIARMSSDYHSFGLIFGQQNNSQNTCILAKI
jgi:hypothetical protein